MNIDQLAATLQAVGSVQRLLILSALAAGPLQMSELARTVQMSRALLYMHVAKLEAAGFITARLELSASGTPRFSKPSRNHRPIQAPTQLKKTTSAMDVDWILLIPIIAIVGGVIYSVTSDRNSNKAKIAEAATPSEAYLDPLRDAAAGNQQLLEQLARIETRIQTIEKTLTDIS